MMATGRAEAGHALDERAEGKRNEDELDARIRRDAREAVAQHVEEPALHGELVEKDDVENDPADREQARRPRRKTVVAAAISAGM